MKFQQIEVTKKNQIEIIGMKNAIINVKHSKDGLKSMKMTEDRMSELQDRAIQFLQYE